MSKLKPESKEFITYTIEAVRLFNKCPLLAKEILIKKSHPKRKAKISDYFYAELLHNDIDLIKTDIEENIEAKLKAKQILNLYKESTAGDDIKSEKSLTTVDGTANHVKVISDIKHITINNERYGYATIIASHDGAEFLEFNTDIPFFDQNISGICFDILIPSGIKMKKGESDEEFAARKKALLEKSKTGKTTAKQQVAETEAEFTDRLNANGAIFKRKIYTPSDVEKESVNRLLTQTVRGLNELLNADGNPAAPNIKSCITCEYRKDGHCPCLGF